MSKIFSKMVFTFAAASMLCAINVASAQETRVAASIPFSKDAHIREAVRNECNLQTKLAGFIQSYAEKNDISVVLSDKSLSKKSKGRVLVLYITDVNGAGGGAWSGSKSVQVKGTLYNNGKSIGDFVASRYSGGGMFAGFKGTCSILGRCVKTLGSDIAKWLVHPSKGARLG